MRTVQPTIFDLGTLTGDVLLFGGPYSNLQASRALLAQAEARAIPAHRRICTGDVIAYCANPAETWELLAGQAVIVAGNCEKQIAADGPDCGCGFEAGSACERASRDWFSHARKRLGSRAVEDMGRLPDMAVFQHTGRRYAVLHGAVSDTARFIWPVTPEQDFRHELELLQHLLGPVDAVIAGHCGVAFTRRVGAVDWINAGVIGMPPNDGTRQGAFAILGADGLRFERLDYDAATASNAMTAAGLTQDYEKSLLSGYWPNEDILPVKMRVQAAGGPQSLRANG